MAQEHHNEMEEGSCRWTCLATNAGAELQQYHGQSYLVNILPKLNRT